MQTIERKFPLMKYNGLICLLLMTVVFLSCEHGHDEFVSAEYELGIEPQHDTLRFSDIYSSYEVVELQDIIVSDITDVIILDSIYIIRCHAYDSYDNPEKGAAVSIFSEDGKYLFPLIHIGRGPEEVLTIEDMCYNYKSGTLDVLCNYGQYIYRYDISERELIDKVMLDQEEIIVAAGISPVSENKYLVYKKYPYSKKEEYKLYLFDIETGEIEARFLGMDKRLAEKLAFGQKNNLMEIGDTVCYYAAFEQAVYMFSEGEFKQYVKFEENKYSVPESFMKKTSMDLYKTISELQDSPYIWGQINMYYYSGYFMSSYTYADNIYLSVINPERNYSFSYSAIFDDMVMNVVTEDVSDVYMLVGSSENGVCYTIEPYVMKDILKEDTSIDKKERKMVMNSADDANPVLLIMH